MSEPYFERDGVTIYHGDCREIMPALAGVGAVIADPPYAQTSLAWDRRVEGWLEACPRVSLWCFGSLRSFMAEAAAFDRAGWKMAQDIIGKDEPVDVEVVWEKHNGSSFHADRFRRVHEQVAHFYPIEVAWAQVYRSPVKTMDATARTVRRKTRPTHMGHIENGAYESQDGGPRLMRSVIPVRSTHGYAVHPTQKPLGIVTPLIEYSAPAGALILDPFMGSGTTLEAARATGRRAIGIEIDEHWCEVAAERLSASPVAEGETK